MPVSSREASVDQIRNAATGARKHAFTLFGEFKTFAFKGNMIDLAIGVIIGTAFAKLIDSLVKHVMLPLLAVFLPGDQSYVGWTWEFRGKEVPFGLFLGEVVNFTIISLVLFLFAIK